MTNGLDQKNQFQFDFSSETQAIYHEFFDSLNYIIEQAIEGFMPQLDEISDFVGWYLSFIHRERDFFLKLFPDSSIQRFEHFLKTNEFTWVG